MRVGSLFSGIGGFELAAEALGWRVAWQAEVEAACCHWLKEKFPETPNLGDVTLIDWSLVEPVDVLVGGFPCQPHSSAGAKKGGEDERNLWPEVVRCVRVLRPRYCVFENVPGLLVSDGGRFFAGVLRDLAEIGYDAEWTHLGAGDIGAPHGRNRIWIVAYPTMAHPPGVRLPPGRGQRDFCEADGGPGGALLPIPAVDGGRFQRWGDAVPFAGADGSLRLIPRDAATNGNESSLWPVADGVPGTLARLHAIGNAVSPPAALEILLRVRAHGVTR